ncbi:hypothetical protein OAB07_02640 [Candidatus Pelagibacter sp.]|nr:hypothetical protein [Candidatus Pelagibacter sp.]
MKKILNSYIDFISIFLIKIALKFNSHRLCGFLIWLNIRKIKKIKTKLKNTKKILVFPKSGGFEDLVESFAKKNSNITFYLLPRAFLKEVFNHFFKQNDKNRIRDYFTKLNTLDKIEKKNAYINFLTLTFKYINNFLKLDGYVSFNLFYYAEKYFDEVCVNLNSKFIILQKESIFTPEEEAGAVKIYEKYNEKSKAYKVSVYSQSQKKILIKSNLINKEKVIVNGNPRSDYSFKLRKIKPKGKTIVYYLIQINRGSNFFIENKNINWKKLYNQTLQYIIEFARQNPTYKIILKGKNGVHKKHHFNSKTLPKNCFFFQDGMGHKLLKDASAVIAFNSTIVLEAILANRNLIIPNFNNENILKKKFLLNIKNNEYFANNKKQFIKKINDYLRLKYKAEKLSKSDLETLKYYVGNADGKSGIRVQKFIRRILN